MDKKLNKTTAAVIVGCLLMLAGLWQLSERFFGDWFGEFWHVIRLVLNILWPLVLVAAGIFLVVAAQRGKLNLPTNKKLYRSATNKKLAGVCGGIAEYLNVDPAVVRIVAIVLGIALWYVIVPLYLIFWVIIPIDDRKNYNKWV